MIRCKGDMGIKDWALIKDVRKKEQYLKFDFILIEELSFL